jgi:hypothetical protein
MEINEDMRMCSFNKEKVYTNIPKAEVVNITENMIENSPGTITTNKKINNKHINKDIGTKLLQFDQQDYKQTEGLAVGAPTSTILAELYIQYMKHK